MNTEIKNKLMAKPFYLNESKIEWVENQLSSLSLEEKVGQLFCVHYGKGTKEEIDYVYNILSPGACMYRSLPIASAVEFTYQIRELDKIPSLIAANLEKGGNGIAVEGTMYGSPMEVGAARDKIYGERLAEICSVEGKAVGANWSFAPIIDIDYNFRNPITNTRTFGSDPEIVELMGKTYVEGIQKAGIAASIKHFPGDGVDERDQHLVTSVNDLSCEEWDETFGKIYKSCIDVGAMSCMIGHIQQPAYTKHFNPSIKDQDIMPASLSKELMIDLLRGQLDFNGLIVTDATTMAGFTLPMSRKLAVPTCIANGADMFLFARNLKEDYNFMLDGVKDGIITAERLDEAVIRILAMKAALNLDGELPKISLEAAKEVVGCKKHKDWARELADKAITLVKNEEGVLPLTTGKYKNILFYAIESAGGFSQYKTEEGVPQKVIGMLEEYGFNVDVFAPEKAVEGMTAPTTDVIDKYDVIIYLSNLATKSNQTTVRIEWAQPMGANCMHYQNDVPSIFISVENPYHLLDVPRAKTFINTYNANEICLEELVKKLVGETEFKGISPVDAFCGRWDTRL